MNELVFLKDCTIWVAIEFTMHMMFETYKINLISLMNTGSYSPFATLEMTILRCAINKKIANDICKS